MSAANEVRRKIAYILVSFSLLLVLAGIFTDTSWGVLGAALGLLLLLMGVVMFTSVSVVEGVPWLVRLVSRHTEPAWDGEVIQTEGGGHKVRYTFDHRGSPWFVASDVCIAIGTRAPIRDAQKWAGIPLFVHAGHPCFSEESVQAYLSPLANKNLAANRLLLVMRNNIFRRLDKQREASNRAE